MENVSMWGGMLVGWLLLTPIIVAFVSARWGGEETAMVAGLRERMHHDEDVVLPGERPEQAGTSVDATYPPRGGVRGNDYRDRGDPRNQPRH